MIARSAFYLYTLRLRSLPVTVVLTFTLQFGRSDIVDSHTRSTFTLRLGFLRFRRLHHVCVIVSFRTLYVVTGFLRAFYLDTLHVLIFHRYVCSPRLSHVCGYHARSSHLLLITTFTTRFVPVHGSFYVYTVYCCLFHVCSVYTHTPRGCVYRGCSCYWFVRSIYVYVPRCSFDWGPDLRSTAATRL